MKNQKGSLTVEAVIVLPIVIISLLFIVNMMNIFYLQAAMQQALNSTAKILAQYSYVIDKAGYTDKAAEYFTMSAGTSAKSTQIQSSVDTLTTSASSALQTINGGLSIDNIGSVIGDLSSFSSSASTLAQTLGSITGDDLVDFAMSELLNGASGFLVGMLANSYLRDMQVNFDRLDNIDYTSSKFFYGSDKEISLVVTATYLNPFDFFGYSEIELVRISTIRPWIGDENGGPFDRANTNSGGNGTWTLPQRAPHQPPRQH